MFGVFLVLALASSQARSVIYPSSAQMPPRRILRMDAEDLEDWSASVSGSYSSNADLENRLGIKKLIGGARKLAQIGAALGYDAADADNWTWDRTIMIGGPKGKAPTYYYDSNKDNKIYARDSEDLDNWSASVSGSYSSNADLENMLKKRKVQKAKNLAKLSSSLKSAADELNNWSCSGSVSVSSNADEVENGGINWGEITKIAGQVNQIGKVLGFAAEDLEDWSASVSGSYSSNSDLENGINLGKVVRQVAPLLLFEELSNEFGGMGSAMGSIGNALGYDAEDLNNWSASVSGSYSSNADLENMLKKRKVQKAKNLAKLSSSLKSAADELNNWSCSGSVSVSSNADEVENGGINWGEITKIAGQVNQIGKVLGFAAEDLNNTFYL